MFGKFGRKNPVPGPAANHAAKHAASPAANAAANAGPANPGAANPGAAALRRVIEEREASDPLLGPKIAGKVLLERLLALMKDERGVHVESLATALGALAGRSCQMAALQGLNSGEPEYRGLSLVSVEGANGDEYFFGDAINRPLAESPYSLWGLVAGAAHQQGAQLPDLNELFANSANSVGGENFGVPRFAPGTRAADTPRNYLALWNPLFPVMQESAPRPQQWPIAYGIAVQNLFAMTNGQFDLGVLTRVVMDSAIAMSKLKVA
jgi:hypothetical protein